MDDTVTNLFQQVHFEALINNSRSITRWEVFKKENHEVQDRLKLFLKSLRIPVMIPVGNKAMFRGQLVHTNDIMISLGDGYFVKGSVEQAIKISERRIQRCNDILRALMKEKQLLESRIKQNMNPDIFAGEGVIDITEPYDEQKETEWLKERSKKVKIQAQALKEERDDLKDEEFFKRLDYLEMQEELQDELIRLGVDEDDLDNISYSESEDEQFSEISQNNCTHLSEEHTEKSVDSPSFQKSKTKSRCVAFDDIESTDSLNVSDEVSSKNVNNEDENQLPVSSNVIEKNIGESKSLTENRPMSKFKASRKKK